MRCKWHTCGFQEKPLGALNKGPQIAAPETVTRWCSSSESRSPPSYKLVYNLNELVRSTMFTQVKLELCSPT